MTSPFYASLKTPEELLDAVRDRFKDALLESHVEHGYVVVRIARAGLLEMLRVLKTQFYFDLLSDLTCIDYSELDRTPRFVVLYNLYSIGATKLRILVRVGLEEADPTIDSATPLYDSANWYEREVYDMYGIHFNHHPDLRRILMYDSFEGHPLRKDYPIDRRQPLVGPIN